MLQQVLKPFDYSSNGVDIARLEAGSEVDIDDGAVQGLRAEGLVGDPPPAPKGAKAAAPPAPAVEAPAEA